MTAHAETTDAAWGAWRARHNEATATPDGYAAMLDTCRELGLTWVDHADIYDDGAVEALHGEALRARPDLRGPFRIVTKCAVRFPSPGQPGVRVHHYRSDAAFIRDQAEASLRRLGVERVDLLLLHRPDYLLLAEETAGALDALKRDGKIAAYGVSNFSVSQLALLADRAAAPIAAHQLELSPLVTVALDDGRLDQAQQIGAMVLVWSPLGGGRLFDDADPVATRTRAALTAVGERHGVADPAAAALAWVRRHPTRPLPIIGTTRADRLRAQVEGMRAIAMDPQDWYEVLEASRGGEVP
ncbi:MAG: aldo/keto reductase [Caulobacterales bacterium]|nr:aldo/keto reductase [Caulobacterales bacterium]